MAKLKRTAAELEELILARAAHYVECKGCTGVSVIGLADRKFRANWTVGRTDNATPMCRKRIEEVVVKLQARYDLSKKTVSTAASA